MRKKARKKTERQSRRAWRCRCGTDTFAVEKPEGGYIIAPHLKPPKPEEVEQCLIREEE